jgi:DNA-binding NtrC family response regulator
VSDVIDNKTMEALTQYRWPGNVRELRNVVEATLAMGEGHVPEHGGPVRDGADPFARMLGQEYKAARAAVLEEFESRYLSDLMERTKGNVSQAAREAGVDRSYLTSLLRRHKIR